MNALIIMTRVPVPDKTKTRLMDVYTGRECAELQECFLKDIFEMCEGIRRRMDIFVTYTPEFETVRLRGYTPGYMKLFPQEGEDLGRRMLNSIRHILSKGYEKVVLIGSDIPEVKPEAVLQAMEALDSNDMCIGPTYDGGYYLIGMKKPEQAVFEPDIRWGGETVFENTVRLARNSGLSVSVVRECRDIDTKEDIRGLMREHRRMIPENTFRYIENNWRDCFGERSNEKIQSGKRTGRERISGRGDGGMHRVQGLFEELQNAQ